MIFFFLLQIFELLTLFNRAAWVWKSRLASFIGTFQASGGYFSPSKDWNKCFLLHFTTTPGTPPRFFFFSFLPPPPRKREKGTRTLRVGRLVVFFPFFTIEKQLANWLGSCNKRKKTKRRHIRNRFFFPPFCLTIFEIGASRTPQYKPRRLNEKENTEEEAKKKKKKKKRAYPVLHSWFGSLRMTDDRKGQWEKVQRGQQVATRL